MASKQPVMITTHLVVNNRGSVRLSKTGTGVKPDEIAILVKLLVPSRLFDRPIPFVRIEIPDAAVADATPEVMVELTAQQVADALGVSVTDARDGLTEAIARGRR